MPARLVFLLGVLFVFMVVPSAVDLLTEWFWFGEVGYTAVFIRSLTARATLGGIVLLATFAILAFNFRTALGHVTRPYMLFPGGGDIQPVVLNQRQLQLLGTGVAGLVAVFLGLFASNEWLTWLQFQEQVPFGQTDPLFGRDVAFYIFTLPFLDLVRYLLMAALILSIIGSGAAYVVSGVLMLDPTQGPVVADPARKHLGLLVAAFFLMLAWGEYLNVPRLLTTPGGVVHGASYVDAVMRVPIHWVLMGVALLGAGLSGLSAFSARNTPAIAAVGLYALVTVGGNLGSVALQRLVVTPDEQQREAPYIAHSIAATRQAFGLEAVEERELSGDEILTLADIQNNTDTINNVRLWDHEPLLDTFGQIQEIRTYYDFASVDNDRYLIDGEYRQIMLSSRELNSDSLPNRSWVNERLQYTHGFGVAMGPVNQVTQEGLPVLFIQDLPPTSSVDLQVDQPSIYFGELSNDYVIVNTDTDEFHYPEGEDNVSTRYDGSGGVPLSSLVRRLLYAARFQAYEILVSGQLSGESRIIYHRNILDRVTTVAPFLRYDSDPYLVISEGRLLWMVDAYTVSDRYPYAQPAPNRVNYIRNAVKIVIDAYDGTMTFYQADADDPIARTLQAIFPELLRPLDDMPEDLRRHVRYPEGLFTLQTEIYSTFHMTNPAVFYNREDQWEVPVIDGEEMEPYYTIMRLPGEPRAEFIQMLPFTPRGRNNMAAWMAARSDGDQYGKILVFQFPKQKLVFGPSQVVARINQDQEISPQITLWNQQGSEVIQGTLLVVPIEGALLYIRPLYLRASGGRIPELRRVIVAYQNQIVMEETLDEALDRLFGSGAPAAPPLAPEAILASQDDTPAVLDPPAAADGDPLVSQASAHYQRALEAQRNGDWALYGEEIERLGEILEQLSSGP
ncbi:MAG: membrane protein [Acidimicrobiaceae bacterium]|nr:membrane protein [Acidimicrobiaceae bacterium]